MATAQKITAANALTLLKLSTKARDDTPDGNIYFDDENNEIQLIGADELAQVDFGGGAEDNPLTIDDGITMQALYVFENAYRKSNETLRKFFRNTKGTYKYVGAYVLNRAAKLNGNDWDKIRDSGVVCYHGDFEQIDRIYFGARSLNNIEATSQPYYALVEDTAESTLQAATWTDFNRQGPINELIQVYGDTTYGDAGAGDFDYTERILVVRLRTFNQLFDETTSIDNGIVELSGFSAGLGIGESTNPFNSFDIADVWGVAQQSPWTGMTLEKLDTPQTETGFNESDGDFTWVLHNTASGTVDECAAFLDAAAIEDDDIDDGSGTYNGKKGRVWYTRDAQGRVITSQGLFVEGLATAEKQKIIMTDDAGDQKTYPYFPEIRIDVGAIAKSDPDAWYHVFYEDGAGDLDFDTADAVTVKNADGDDVKGDASDADVNNIISFAYDYDGNTQAGLSAGTNKACVVLVEGNGVAAQAIARFTITRDPVINVTCAPGVENNA